MSTLLCPSDGAEPTGAADTNYGMCFGDNGTAFQFSNPSIARQRGRGIFVANWSWNDATTDPNAANVHTGFNAARDGTTSTILAGEIGRGDTFDFRAGVAVVSLTEAGGGYENPGANCLTNASIIDPADPGSYLASTTFTGDPADPAQGQRGTAYANAYATYTGFNTILPPNSPNCAPAASVYSHRGKGIYSAGSYHPGTVQVVMIDGSVQSVSDTINTGNLAATNPIKGPSPYGTWGELGTAAGGEVVGEF